MLSTLGAWMIDPTALWSQTRPEFRVNGPRVLKLLEELAAFGHTKEDGVSRVAYSAATDERLREFVAESAQSLGLTSHRMPSGAGHDAQSLAQLGPIGMIFIPSVGGISHSPKELSRPEDIVSGVNVLLHTLLKTDASL